MFGEVSKPLSAEMSEIFKSRPNYKMGLSSYRYSKMSFFVIVLIINYYHVSYEVDKAYKVILCLIFEVLGQIIPFDRMRKTDM